MCACGCVWCIYCIYMSSVFKWVGGEPLQAMLPRDKLHYSIRSQGYIRYTNIVQMKLTQRRLIDELLLKHTDTRQYKKWTNVSYCVTHTQHRNKIFWDDWEHHHLITKYWQSSATESRRALSWLSWHLAVGDATGHPPFYTTVSLWNRMHPLSLIHTHRTHCWPLFCI